jgi:hypothetical protein
MCLPFPPATSIDETKAFVLLGTRDDDDDDDDDDEHIRHGSKKNIKRM